MTAIHRLTGTEVAVKFILKEKVPDHSWMEDKVGSREARSFITYDDKHRTFADCCQLRLCCSA